MIVRLQVFPPFLDDEEGLLLLDVISAYPDGHTKVRRPTCLHLLDLFTSRD